MRITAQTLMLERAAVALEPILAEIVFVGGSVVGLLLTDPAAAAPRPTDDVDVIVRAATRVEYYPVEKRMSEMGFIQNPEDKVICRWNGHSLTVDIMPTNDDILGFASRWYEPAIKSAVQTVLPNGATINVINGPHLLATKLEAFVDRGREDILGSHDLEDIILLVDGRPELTGEVRNSDMELQVYIGNIVQQILDFPKIEDAIEGHLGSLLDASDRLSLVRERLQILTKC